MVNIWLIYGLYMANILLMGFHSHGTPRMDGWEHTSYNWMMTWGTPIYGNPQILWMRIWHSIKVENFPFGSSSRFELHIDLFPPWRTIQIVDLLSFCVMSIWNQPPSFPALWWKLTIFCLLSTFLGFPWSFLPLWLPSFASNPQD